MANVETEIPVTFSENALKEILRIKVQEKNEAPLRIGVKTGGCSGFEYILDFQDAEDGDEFYQIDDLQIIIHPTHLLHLNGMKIDYENGLNNRGFTFENPNANTTCGCGNSFG